MRGLVRIFLIILIALGAALLVYKRLRPKPPSEPSSRNEFSVNHEMWVASLDGSRTHASCKGNLLAKLSLQILFPAELAQTLATPATQFPRRVRGIAVVEGSETSFGAEPSQVKALNVESVAVWKEIDQSGVLQIDLDSPEAILPGNCVQKGQPHSDPRRHLRLITRRFENNTLLGKWTTEDENEGGNFTLQWSSGGASPQTIPGPLNVRTVASSKNVTVSWRPFPGAEFYRVYVLKKPTLDPENVVKIQEAKGEVAIVPDLTSGTVYAFVVTAVVAGDESSLSEILLAKSGTPIRAKQVKAGAHHACAVLMDDSVLCWGANSAGQVEAPSSTWSLPVVSSQSDTAANLRVEGDLTCASNKLGPEKCWGSKSPATQSRFDCRQEPDGNVLCSGRPIRDFEMFKPESLTLGEDFACALSRSEIIYCWGANALGQLGNGSGGFSNIPQPVN